MISVRGHLAMTIAAEFAGFLVAAFGYVLWTGLPEFQLRSIFGCFLAVLLGTLIPRIVFRKFIPAQCPACSGSMYVADENPVAYRCRSCGWHSRAGSLSSP